jgi:hypothetical protein
MSAYDAPELVDFAESLELFREWAKADMLEDRRPAVQEKEMGRSGAGE